jgi:hypothetical protein
MPSRGAAKECSPRRKPWGNASKEKQSPGGATERIARITLRVLSRLRGFNYCDGIEPTAYAVGYILPPLRGSSPRDGRRRRASSASFITVAAPTKLPGSGTMR